MNEDFYRCVLAVLLLARLRADGHDETPETYAQEVVIEKEWETLSELEQSLVNQVSSMLRKK